MLRVGNIHIIHSRVIFLIFQIIVNFMEIISSCSIFSCLPDILRYWCSVPLSSIFCVSCNKVGLHSSSHWWNASAIALASHIKKTNCRILNKQWKYCAIFFPYSPCTIRRMSRSHVLKFATLNDLFVVCMVVLLLFRFLLDCSPHLS